VEIWDLKRRDEATKSLEMQAQIEKEWEKSLKITILTDLLFRTGKLFIRTRNV
jgi:hypothetical protein